MILKEKPADFKPKFEVSACALECNGEFLLLQRQNDRPQGNTWAFPGGKFEKGESARSALARELREEIGFDADPDRFEFFQSFPIRFKEFDFIYHVFRMPLDEKPQIVLDLAESKGYAWKSPQESLLLDLIEDEDACIKMLYHL